MCVQLGNVVANFMYVSSDKPKYHKGNTKLVAINLVALVLFVLTKIYYVLRNKQRDRMWNALSEEQKADYVKNTRLQGSRRLDFRFAH
jgi:cbb3-type cytochrome oxidase subunit 3